MPSKLRKAIGAVKDQTSISLAKVTNAANLEVTILKATSHDEIPVEERYVNDILQAVSSNKVYAAVCAHSIGKRISKTRNWVVALKSLMLVLRIFQDGDPHFPREVFHQMKKGAKILNLSSFKDDSNSSPWDYSAFVRTFALYLDERLDCFLTGKLQRRFTYFNQTRDRHHRDRRSMEPGIKDMKPTMLLDKISYWQKLLDRAIGTRPTGPARINRLVKVALYAILQESFVLYKDISDGLVVILDSFFQLPYQASVKAFQACVKSSKQFDELTDFYSLCASIGIGRTSEYPSVQKVSEELLETLQEFLKDQAPFPVSNNGYPLLLKHSSLPNPKDPGSSCGTPEKFSETQSRCTSLEDLMNDTEIEIEMYSEQSDQDDSGLDEQEELKNQMKEKKHKNASLGSKNGTRDTWESVLAKTITKPDLNSNGSDPFVVDTLFDQSSVPEHQYNPFLEDVAIATPPSPTFSFASDQGHLIDLLETAPTFQAVAPAFSAHKSIEPTTAPNGMPTVPAFNNRGNAETIMASAFHAQYPSRLSAAHSAPTFPVHSFNEMTTTPTLNAQTPVENGWSRTFHGHNANGMNTVPAFRADSLHRSTTEPTFHAQSFDGGIAAPTFRAKDSNYTTLVRDDPFGPWPSAVANQHTSKPEESVLQQQKMWLQQQSKTIAKRMT